MSRVRSSGNEVFVNHLFDWVVEKANSIRFGDVQLCIHIRDGAIQMAEKTCRETELPPDGGLSIITHDS